MSSLVQVVVTGTGCPLVTSCVILNAALTSASATQVVVPLTIETPGTYVIRTRNGPDAPLSVPLP